MGVGILPSRPRSPGAHGVENSSTLKFLQTQAPADHSAHYDFALGAGNQWFKFFHAEVDLSFLLNRGTRPFLCVSPFYLCHDSGQSGESCISVLLVLSPNVRESVAMRLEI